MDQKKEDQMVKDMVCGMVKPISQMKYKSEFLGKPYYFDSENDKQLFDAHPEYWVPTEEREKFRKGT
jgi:YHS domain-containing protein